MYEPRIIGVNNPERFLQLMTNKLAQIESNFFNSFRLDIHYVLLEDMLKNIDMLSDTNTDTQLNGTNNSTIDSTRTDNLQSTKSARTDSKRDDSNVSETDGARTDTQDTVNGGTLTRDTNYGKKDTLSGSDTTTNSGTDTTSSRVVGSQFPQSNIGSVISGIDANLSWDYATGAQDTKQSLTKNGTSKTDYGRTDTQSGTDQELTKDNRTVMITSVKGEQVNNTEATVNSTFNEGEQSVSNTGTQENRETEDRTHSQTGKYKKVNDNSGRTDNIAKIRLEWRQLLHETLSAYSYLFKELDILFYSLWDLDDDCYNII